MPQIKARKSRSFCWAHMAHFDIDANGKIIDTSKISLDHYQYLPAFMLMVCCVFIGVEIFWWVGEIERVPFHVDYFINCLEDAFEEFGRTLLLEKTSQTSEMVKTRTGTASKECLDLHWSGKKLILSWHEVANSTCDDSDGINDDNAPILSNR